MNIKILGPGCPKCKELDRRVKEIVQKLGVQAQVEEVKDIKTIMEYPILTTPGLVIDEKLVFSGRVPTRDEITRLINNALGH